MDEGNSLINGEQDANSVSSEKAGQPLPDQSKQIETLLKRLDAQEGEIRALKSGKDKAVARVEAQTKDALERYAQVLGIEPEKMQQAKRQVAIEELADAYLDGTQPESPSEGTGGETGSAIGEFVKQLGLDTNDKDVAEAVTKGDFGALALKFADKQKNSTATTPPIDKGLAQSGTQRRSDAQILQDVFGKRAGAFDLDTIRELGGGVFMKK